MIRGRLGTTRSHWHQLPQSPHHGGSSSTWHCMTAILRSIETMLNSPPIFHVHLTRLLIWVGAGNLGWPMLTRMTAACACHCHSRAWCKSRDPPRSSGGTCSGNTAVNSPTLVHCEQVHCRLSLTSGRLHRAWNHKHDHPASNQRSS